MTRVLIVERSDSIRVLVRDFLKLMKDFSFIISEATDGQEACEIIKIKDIDLIISGNSMPGMSGLLLARKVKAKDSKYKEIPFIFSSGAPGEYQKEIEKLGAISLPKPYTLEGFQKLVRSLL